MADAAWQFDRTGDHLALDLANTISDRKGEHPIDRLTDYARLVEFARQTDLVSQAEARRLLARAAAAPGEAAQVQRGAVALRDALYGIFEGAVRGTPAPAACLEVFNRFVARLRIGGDLGWTFATEASGLDGFVGRIVLEAVRLATGDGRGRVRLCEASNCGWLFLDGSKNHSRRWCDMKVCGNRAKARRFHRGKASQRGAD